jgi:hypothetical protein
MPRDMKSALHRRVRPQPFANAPVRRRLWPGVLPARGLIGAGATRQVRAQRGSAPREGTMALVWTGIGFFAGILLMHCLAAARIAADRVARPAPKSAGGPSVGCLIRSGPREVSLVAARAVRSVLLRVAATTDLTALTSRMTGVQANALAEGEPPRRKGLPCSSPPRNAGRPNT